MADDPRIERLHMRIGQLFEANLDLQKAIEARDRTIAELRRQIEGVPSQTT